MLILVVYDFRFRAWLQSIDRLFVQKIDNVAYFFVLNRAVKKYRQCSIGYHRSNFTPAAVEKTQNILKL